MVLTVKTRSRTEMVDISADVGRVVAERGVREGLCMLYVPHTTAGVTINESADPSVRADILMVLNQMVPWKADYRHAEGNAAAHVKSVLVGHAATVPVHDGRLALGRWQEIFFCEFDGPRTRQVELRLLRS